MGSIQNELAEGIRTVGANARVLSGTDSDQILAALRSRFGAGNGARALWEDLSDKASHHNPDAWRWISDYVQDRHCLLATRPSLERAAFEFGSGEDLVKVLAECSAFEFYVTDKEFSYILCFNHHDYLIAVGSAKNWLQGRVSAT